MAAGPNLGIVRKQGRSWVRAQVEKRELQQAKDCACYCRPSTHAETMMPEQSQRNAFQTKTHTSSVSNPSTGEGDVERFGEVIVMLIYRSASGGELIGVDGNNNFMFQCLFHL